MKKAFRIVLLVVCIFAGGTSMAAAEDTAAQAIIAPAPATMMPALPVPQPTPHAPPAGMALPLPPPATLIPPPAFPALPPSRPCAKPDIVGIWKLLQVYEQPPGHETAEVQNNPVQYLIFNDDDTYSPYNAGRNDLSIQGLRDAVALQKKDLLQYVIGDKGMTYFYKNGIAVDTQACFIVANHLGNFLLGQMLLMPPEGQVQGRLVKVYSKIWQPTPPPRRGRRRR